MPCLPRHHPLTTRLLALLLAGVLLAVQTLASVHAAEGCDAARSANGSLPEAGADHPAHDGDGEAAEAACALCVFKASASEWGLPPPEATPSRTLRPHADAPVAGTRACPVGRTPLRAPARGPPAQHGHA
jgi:hypothetical protein